MEEAKAGRPKVTFMHVLLCLLILVIAFDAWGTWANNKILRARNALFDRMKSEHAELLKRCGE